MKPYFYGTPIPKERSNRMVSTLRVAIGILNDRQSSGTDEEREAIDEAVNVLERRIYEIRRRTR